MPELFEMQLDEAASFGVLRLVAAFELANTVND